MHIEYTDKKRYSKRDIDALMHADFSSIAEGNISIRAQGRTYFLIQVSYDRRLYPNAVRNWVIEQWRDSHGTLVSVAYTSIDQLNGLIKPNSLNGHLFTQLLCCSGKITEEYACKYSFDSKGRDIQKLDEYLVLFTRLVNAGIVI